MKMIVTAFLVAVATVHFTEASGYGSFQQSQQQRSGQRVSVLDSASSNSQSLFDQDTQDSSVSSSNSGRSPVLPLVRGWIKKSVPGASGSEDSDSDAADDSPVPASNYGNQQQSSVKASSGSSTSAAVDQVQTQAGGGPVQTGVVYPPIVNGGVAPPQIPGVWEALDVLRGKPRISEEEIQALLAAAQPDVDYPVLSEIPDQVNFNCANVKQAGYYADTDFRCQVFRRCDIDGQETSYLCPEQTLFNQITLVCDWFYNINCANSAQFQDYSNSRLYHEDWLLFDTPPEVDLSNVDAGQLAAINAANGHRKSAKRRTGNGGSRKQSRGNAPIQPALPKY